MTRKQGPRILPLLCALAPSAVVAGQSVVLPSNALAAPAPGGAANNATVFVGSSSGPIAARSQFLYDAAEIPAAGAIFKAMAVRAPTVGQGSSANTALSVDVQITLSISPLDSASMSPTFAANRGVLTTTVFNGRVSLPMRTIGSWPAPWEAAIPFSSPWTWAAGLGRGLLVDIHSSNNSTNGTTAGSSWLVEAYQPDWGSAELLGAGCPGGGSFTHRPVITGGTFHYTIAGGTLPLLVNNLVVFGVQHGAGTWAGLRLPFRLGRTGIPSGTGCYWSIDWVASAPMTYDPTANSLSGPGVPIPNTPSLVGASFDTQTLGVALSGYPQPVLYSGLAWKWSIGDGRPLGVSQVVATYDPSVGPAPPTGSLLVGLGATFRLDT